jgi:hypothetical protein
MATLIKNIGRVPLQVGLIETKTGKATSSRVMGRGNGKVPEGHIIDPNWMALNGKNIKTFDTATLVKPVVAKPKTMSSKKVKPAAPAQTIAANTAPTVATKGA